MSADKILIAKNIVQEFCWDLPDITNSQKPPHLLEYKYSDDGYGLVGRIEYGQESEHHDLEKLIIRVVGEGYFSTTVATPRDNSEFEWDEEYEEGETFVVWRKVEPVQVTRYIWKETN
jgi:hypothetical protein